jgi:hypothetical protein
LTLDRHHYHYHHHLNCPAGCSFSFPQDMQPAPRMKVYPAGYTLVQLDDPRIRRFSQDAEPDTEAVQRLLTEWRQKHVPRFRETAALDLVLARGEVDPASVVRAPLGRETPCLQFQPDAALEKSSPLVLAANGANRTAAMSLETAAQKQALQVMKRRQRQMHAAPSVMLEAAIGGLERDLAERTRWLARVFWEGEQQGVPFRRPPSG